MHHRHHHHHSNPHPLTPTPTVTVQVTWLKEGAPLDVANTPRFIPLPDQGTGSHRLLLTSATDADVGTYGCEAANMYGTQRDTTYGECMCWYQL